jgi:peptidyl-prolyl cis-trans isomerase D
MIRFLQTPGPTKKIVLGGMLGILCISMLVYLIPSGTNSNLFGVSGPGQGIVANVGSEQVSAVEVQREARGMLQQQFPRGGAQASALLPFFASRAAESLISRKAVLAEAQRLGLRASDEEVRDDLQHGRYAATFFPNGTFIGQEAYQDLLAQHDLTSPVFEQSVKDDILLEKLRNLVAGGAIVSDAEVHQAFLKQNTKVKFDYAVLRTEDVSKEIHPAEAELKAYFDAHNATYKNAIPEKRKIRYAVIDTSKLSAESQVTAQDLQNYYQQHIDEYRVPEQVNVRHILIKTPLPGSDGNVDPKGAEEARKKAEDVLKQVKAGGNFADLAKKYSEDPGSAKNGGSLDWVGRGRTVPEFEKVAFSLPKGGTSDLVQSSYGFHIIHVDDKQDAHVKTLAEVKDQIEPLIKQQKSAQAAEGQANSLLSQARTNGLEKAASARGLQVVNTDFVSNSDSLPGMTNSEQFLSTVFRSAEKSPPDMAQLPQGYAVFEVLQVKPPATPAFEEIRSRVESDFKNERASLLLNQKAKELADRAKASHDLKKAAKELGATLKTSEFVGPDGQVPDIGAMSGQAAVAFGLQTGEIAGPVMTGTNGVVLSLDEKQSPSDQDFASKKDEIRDSLLQNKQNEIFELFVTNLRTQMEKSGKIKINPDEMKNLTHSQSSEEGE